jgi:hypothetical protein
MRKIVATEYLTLDGVFQEPGDKRVLKLVDAKPFSSGVVVLTYEPARSD